MCNRYSTPEIAEIEREWAISRQAPNRWWKPVIGPLQDGPFIRAHNGTQRELVVGQWGMIPPDSKERIPKTKSGVRMSTNNARSELVAKAWTFRFPWSRGQRCIIPATSYDEPYWGPLFEPFAKTVWWRFARADGRPWGLAGIWHEWTDPATGEVVPNYTMLTQNCDAHPLLNKFHKPERDRETKEILPADQQDKRAVVPIEPADYDTWLHGTQEQALALIKLPAPEVFLHGAVDPDQNVPLAV
jgi:putative SOS response-associated peptidase YedK